MTAPRRYDDLAEREVDLARWRRAVVSLWWMPVAGLVVGAIARGRYERPTALAAVLFVLPVAVHGFARWNADGTQDAYALTPGLVHFLRREVPQRSVVFADLETSYRIGAYVPVYVANGPPSHVANTRANAPRRRRGDLLRFLRTGDPAIPRRYGARWLVLRRNELTHLAARPAYRDREFRVFRLQSAP
jgi:hypothetical protein